MMDYLKKQLEAGRDMVSIMNVGGNMQVLLKVKVEAADALGIVARVKGLMGGLGEPKIFPWSGIASLSWD
jgi:hypothetical protein